MNKDNSYMIRQKFTGKVIYTEKENCWIELNRHSNIRISKFRVIKNNIKNRFKEGSYITVYVNGLGGKYNNSPYSFGENINLW